MKLTLRKIRVLTVTMAMVFFVSCGEEDDEDDADTATATTTTTTTASTTTTPTLTLKGSNSLSLVSPSVANVTIYKFAVSASTDCSSPITVFSSTEGKTVDMNAGPDIGSGDLAVGTYPCVIMEMSDAIAFTPATTTGSCTAGTSYTINVCRQFQEGSTITSTLIDGTSVTCTDNAETVAVYISTVAANSTNTPDPFNAPSATETGKGIKLAAALEVTADTTGTFVMDTTDKIDGSNDTCDLQPPVFAFR